MHVSSRKFRFVLFSVGEDHPLLGDLYRHVLREGAIKWRDIGVLLLDPANQYMLEIIEKDHPRDVIRCCKLMLEKWLATKPDASWSQLLDVLRTPCIQLNILAHQIEHKLQKKCKTISVLYYVINFGKKYSSR